MQEDHPEWAAGRHFEWAAESAGEDWEVAPWSADAAASEEWSRRALALAVTIQSAGIAAAVLTLLAVKFWMSNSIVLWFFGVFQGVMFTIPPSVLSRYPSVALSHPFRLENGTAAKVRYTFLGSGKPDHVFFDYERLVCANVLEPPPGDEMCRLRETQEPCSERFPSDHVPLVCDFTFK